MSDAEKKIDVGWKERAQQEKEEASEETRDDSARPPLPEPTFSMFVETLFLQALIHLGHVQNPMTNKQEKDLEQAKHTIDLLQMLEDKTKGNLTDDEAKRLQNVLYELRMRYVDSCTK